MTNKFNEKRFFISFIQVTFLAFLVLIYFSPLKAAGPGETSGEAVILVVEMDKQNPEIIYAGSADGLFKTEDGGNTWISLLKHVIVWDIEAAGNVIYITTNKGVYKSLDGGKNWSLIFGETGKRPEFVTFGLSNPDIVYIGGNELHTIFKSTDGGKTWKSLEQTLPLGTSFIVNLEADFLDSQVIYTRVEISTSTGEFTRMAIGSKILKSIDGGENWREITNFNFKPQNLVINPKNSAIQYQGTRTGVIKSEDGGKTWRITPGWIVKSATSLVVNPVNPNILYVGTEGKGIWRSVDGGKTWEQAGLRNAVIYSFEVVFDDKGGVIFAVAGTDRGIFKANKDINAEVWELAGKGDFGGYVTLDPTNYNILYAEARVGITYRDPNNLDYFYIGGEPKGVLKSLDAGETWAQINEGLSNRGEVIKYITVDSKSPNIVYLIALENGGVYKSLNGGEKWEKINKGIEDGYGSALAIAPDDSNTLYLGLFETRGGKIQPGVFRSNDGGQTWVTTSLRGKKIRTIKIDPYTVPYTIYAGTYGEGVYMSTDRGETWVPVNEELISRKATVKAIEVIPANFKTAFNNALVFASSQKSLVYFLTDEGIYLHKTLDKEKITETKGTLVLEQKWLRLGLLFLIIPTISFITWWMYKKRAPLKK